ncbi:MAG: class I SAM-dependent methyltransferase [Anaerolineales bacterium]|nr:class I SAM-dependent methyltransferase [Anaerolineales bacterium]MCC6986231.1 class I SAM-dependent methyltransferase [Anaerolineales bacterium]
MDNLNQTTKDAWDANAEVWDKRMGDEGNDFFNLLCWSPLASLLDPKPDSHILDIACGNGLTSRRLAEMGCRVTAFDFSANLIEYAKARTTDPSTRLRANLQSLISYHVIDATDESQLLSLGETKFDSALSNMALFDMADIEPLFRALPKLLKPGGTFVFSITHPCFNNASSMHVVEEMDNNGEMQIAYSVKISRYMTPYSARGLALRNQPVPQIYFERPLQYYLNTAFKNGFILDGFEERAFPPETPQTTPLSWGGKYSEIPAILVARLRLSP